MFAYARLLDLSRLDSLRFGRVLRAVLEPRKPRHRVLRLLLGVIGVALLAVLVAVAVVVGSAMLVLGLGYRLLRGSRAATPTRSKVLDAEYRVVAGPALPASH